MKVDELISFIDTVLRKRFHDVPNKQKIDDSNPRKLSFACPICGDSDKKSSKKRGNIYLDTNSYKCFNDGCMAYMAVGEFIAKMSNELGIMLPSFLLEDSYSAPVKTKRNDNPLIHFLTSDTSNLITITEVINRFSLTRLDSVPEDFETFQYIKNRGLNLIDGYGDFLYCDSLDNKVYVFNFDIRSGKALGFSMRSLDKNADRKYIIKSYTDLSLLFTSSIVDKDIIDDANFLNNYFNILNIDFSKPIRLTEGQFDSMFITNCIATSGVTKARSILLNLGAKSASQIIFDKDSAGKNQMIDLMKKGYSVFLWNKVLTDIQKKYHTDEDILYLKYKVHDINELFMFLLIKKPTLTIDQFNEFINDYFSDSVFDMVYL